MNYLQMINICQDMQDIMQRKYAINVVHRITLREIVNGHTHVMIVKKHTKQDQHYADTALIIGPRVHRVIEVEEILWEETDHKAEEEEVIIREEVEAEDKEVITGDLDILETTKGIKAISEEITEEMQDKHFMKKEDKTSDNMKMDNLTTVGTQITVDGTVDMTSPTGTAAMNGTGVKMEMDMQTQWTDPWMDP